MLLTTLCATATLLTHPNATFFAAYSGITLMLVYGRSRRAMRDVVVVGLGVLLLTAPWWATVLHRHGLTPFVVASTIRDAANPWAALILFAFTGEIMVPPLAVIGLLGMVTAFHHRQPCLPLWLIITCFADHRYGAPFAGVPLC